MPPPDFTAGDVMNTAASLLNDTAQQRFGYTQLLPYVKLAFRELRELLELNNVPVTNRVQTALTIPAGTSEISYVTTPSLPQDLIEIRQLWERAAGVDPYTPMTRRETLPYSLDGQQAANFLIWAWIDNKIKLLPASQSNDLKLDYIAQLTGIVDQNTNIGIINGQSFLEFRTAALASEFVSEDAARAESLNADAEGALDRLTGIETKAKQAIFTRRRPFRQAFKSRGTW
jgi:hypothetical protein